jgi:HK97 family phage major capsid protein
MADLVSMRADAMEARKRIDALLAVDGELTTDQVAELEKSDVEFRGLQAEISKAETIASARESLSAPSFEFRAERKPEQRSQQEIRTQFLSDLKQEMRSPGSFERRTIDFNIGGTPGNAADLLPVDLQDEMIRLFASRSNVAQAATVRSYASDAEIPMVTARATITDFTGEGTAYDNFDPDFGKLRIRAFKSAAETKITEEVISDNRGGAVDEILTQHGEAHAYFWETKYLGTAAAQNATAPDGLLAAEADIASTFPDEALNGTVAIADISTGSGDTTIADVTYQDLLDVTFGMPAKYWGLEKSWLMSPALFQHVIGLTDAGTSGRPLFLPNATGTIQQSFNMGTLFGYPVYVSDAMTDATPAGSFQAVLLERGSYVVATRSQVTSQVDPFTNGASGITAFRTRMRADGRWMRPSSSARLQIAAS